MSVMNEPNKVRPLAEPSRTRLGVRRAARLMLVGLSVAAMLASTISESFAQRRGGFSRAPAVGTRTGATRFPGVANRIPGTVSRFPGGYRPRPGGGMGRIPGGRIPGILMVTPRMPGGPGTIVVMDAIDRPGPRRLKAKPPQSRQGSQNNRSAFQIPPPGEQRYVLDEVLLNVSSSLPIPALDAIARRHRLTRLELLDFSLTGRRLSRWRINDGRPVPAVIRSVRADARILGAQPNYLFALQDQNGEGKPAEPTPPGTALVSEADDGTQYAIGKLKLRQAHQIATGESVLVAVIDSSIDSAHPDLAGVIAGTFNATDLPEKPHAHGTGMAGAIAAHGKLTGSAPGVRILAAKAFETGANAAGSNGTSVSIYKSLEWAVKANARIVNMSFAGPPDPELQLLLASARARGVVLIAAAGNAGPRSRPLYPGADPNVIAVTATDVDDKVFANANRGTHVAVAAPGVDVLALAPGGGYQMTSGTSVAAAEASGVAALLLERDPKLDPGAIRRTLMSTARDLGAPGHDDQFGSGLIDAYAALAPFAGKPASVSSPPAPLQTQPASGTLNQMP